MANVTITFGRATPNAKYAGQPPLPEGDTARSETVDTDVTDFAVALTAIEGDTMCWVAADADCWVAFGDSPDTAAASDGTRQAWLVKSGQPREFFVEPGWSVTLEAA